MKGNESERNWHLSWGGKTYGPFGIEAIKTMASKGEFDPSISYAWKPGFEGWKPCGELEEISSIGPLVQLPPELAKKRIELRLGLGVEKLRLMSLFFDDLGYFYNGLAKVKKDGKWGFIDKAGGLVVEPSFERVDRFSEGLAAVKIGGKWGFIDKSGSLVVEPAFDDVDGFSEGVARVEQNGKVGLIFCFRSEIAERPQPASSEQPPVPPSGV